MASITKRSDGHWRARYRDTKGKEHARHFQRKIAAQRWLDSVTTAMTTGTYVDPVRASISIREWSARWLATKVDLKPTTRCRYEGLLKVNVLPTWGDVPLAAVAHEGVAAWVADLSGSGLAPATVRQAYRVLSMLLALAVRDGRLARNPADHVPLPRAHQREHVYLTIDQVDALAEAAGDERTLVLFLAYTGVRFGELAALRVQRLDLLRRRAAINEAVAEVRGKTVFGTPKTHQARSVPIPPFLLGELSALVSGKGPDGLVFTAPKGGVLRLQNFRHTVWEPAVRAVGLDGLTPHALRHTAASLAIAAGADVKVVQQMLGHKSATMTLDIYGHLYGDRLDEVAARMDAARTKARTRTAATGAAEVVTQLARRRGLT
jgi:integrase